MSRKEFRPFVSDELCCLGEALSCICLWECVLNKQHALRLDLSLNHCVNFVCCNLRRCASKAVMHEHPSRCRILEPLVQNNTRNSDLLHAIILQKRAVRP